MKKNASLNLSLTKETLCHLNAIADPKLMAAQGGGTFMITIFCNPVGQESTACDR